MFGLPKILRLHVLFLVAPIAVISLSTDPIASAQTTAPNQWTWVGGSSTGGASGVYGSQGVPAGANIPGGRSDATFATDGNGNFWLFGGNGLDSAGKSGNLNDLWEFNPTTNEWIWISGSSTLTTPGTVVSAPGGRVDSSSWIDSNGNFWLFSGYGAYTGLWEFTLSTKAWSLVTGSDVCLVSNFPTLNSCNIPPAQYGMLGVPASGNTPGGRKSAVSWTDKNGDFWLFGGMGMDDYGNYDSYMNDLWEFNTSHSAWAWMGGSDTYGQVGIYGTLGTPDAANIPSARQSASSWTDSSGNFWLFGGQGEGLPAGGSLKSLGDLNDLWRFNPSNGEWTWMSGSNSIALPWIFAFPGQPGVYGILGTPAAGNVPGGRYQASSWTDNSGNLWLFGGEGYDSTGNYGNLNDLWRFSPTTSQWTWMAGSNAILESYSGDPGVYGTFGAPAAGNIPGARMDAATWTDKDGNLWLFGGEGLGGDDNWGDDNWGDLNDLWVYQPSTEPLPAAAVPTVSSVSPNYATAGTTIPDVIFITVNGSGFTSSSTVYWGSKVLSTEHDSATELRAGLPAAFMTTAGIIPITVQTPAPGGGTSNSSVSFTVGPATGAITGPTFTSPTATVTAGSLATYAVTLPSSLTNATVSCQNLPIGATCSYSGGTLTITTSSTTPKGTYQINVVFTEAVAGAATASILLPILLLPLVFLRRKQLARGAWTTACLGLVVMAAMTVACVGCSGGGGSASTVTPTPTPTPTPTQSTSSVAVLLTVQ